jgi:hypothetical protein
MGQTRKYESLTERVAQAENLAAANGGFLPRFSVLADTEAALAAAIARNKAAFAHIAKEPNHNRTIAEHVKVAEKIAADHDGLLPSYIDLIKIDKRLASVVRDKSEVFAHIPRALAKSQQRLRAQRVAEAEVLAAANDGVLELTAEFQRDHNALVIYIRRHPEAFAHIPRKRRAMRTLAEHVSDAESLAQKNNGKLPATSVLRKDYPALDEAMRRNREAFAHIDREKKRHNNLNFYVQIAEEVAAQNGGALPNSKRLRKSHRALMNTIYRHPNLFSHIPQEVRDSHGDLIEIRNSAKDTTVAESAPEASEVA